MDVGFLGLGAMGQAMATNLIDAGHRVRVWNRSRAPVDALTAKGATAAATPQDAFAAEAVISMLADDAAAKSVILDSGALNAAPSGLVHVNMATISVSCAEALARSHRERGIAYVAAPVFGRPDAAAAATLHIVAAGPPAAIDRVHPLFDVLGQKTWRVGDEAPRANVMKIAGNFLIACAIEAMSESAALAQAHGLAPRDLFDMLISTLFASPIYKNYSALIIDQRFEPAGFALRLGLKDTRLALAASESAHVALPFGSVLRDNFLDAIAHGDGDRDWTAVARVALRRAGLAPRQIADSQ
jgi:3-hydroxyisobutyrate dehydrogenase-like beta-hydroxyacid dehydrogenase